MKLGKILVVILLLWLVLGQLGGGAMIGFKIFGLLCSLAIKIAFIFGAVWIAKTLIKGKTTDDD
jgi:hypothetical protein